MRRAGVTLPSRERNSKTAMMPIDLTDIFRPIPNICRSESEWKMVSSEKSYFFGNRALFYGTEAPARA